MASLLKWFAINAINWDIGWCSALGTQESQGQVPSFSSRRFNRIETAPPASPPVTDNHHVALNVAGRSENFLVDTGLPALSRPPTLEPSPPKPVAFWVLQEKQSQKDSPEPFFVAGMDKYFPTSFLWCLSILLPLLGRDLSLPLKSCSYCSPDRRCFKTLSWWQTNYFYQPPSETTSES